MTDTVVPISRGRAKKDDAPLVVVNSLALELIEHGRNPRADTDPVLMRSLVASVREYGVLQPIRVRPTTSEGEEVHYQIIAGHRRFEAARAAHLKEIPVVVATPTDSQAFVQSLVENLQREDLDPIDEGRAFQALLDETGWTQVDLARHIGRSQPYVNNSLRLLTGLVVTAQEALSAGKITVSHAKALASAPVEQQDALLKDVIDNKIGTKDLEQKVGRIVKDAQRAVEEAQRITENVARFDALLREHGIQPLSQTAVLVADAKVAAGLAELGYHAVGRNWEQHVTWPNYECACDAVSVETYDQKLRHACIDPQHKKAADAAAKAVEKTRAAEGVKKTDAARKVMEKQLALPSEPGATELGVRIALYLLVVAADYQGELSKTLIKRYGGVAPQSESNDRSAIWAVCESMSVKDLGKELASVQARVLMPNVWAQNVYASQPHAAVRQHFVDAFGMDQDIVWGGHKSPAELQAEREHSAMPSADGGEEQGAEGAADAEAEAIVQPG